MKAASKQKLIRGDNYLDQGETTETSIDKNCKIVVLRNFLYLVFLTVIHHLLFSIFPSKIFCCKQNRLKLFLLNIRSIFQRRKKSNTLPKRC